MQKKINSIKSSTFLHVIGPESLEIYNTCTWAAADVDSMKLDKIMEKIKGYCNHSKITYERHIFNKRNQQAGENIDIQLYLLVGLDNGDVAHNINPDICFLTKAKWSKM